MAVLRQRRLRGLGSLLLALLLLVPVVASGHRHTGGSTAPCAACAVTHHTPVVSAPAVALPTAARMVVGVELAAATAPAAPSVRHATGRGPPSLLRALGA